jgi:RNA polymerase sigma-70 factor, ECF subfamily
MPDNAKLPSFDEKDLLQRAHDLDKVALSVIFDTFYEPIYRYIFQHVRHEQTAEDITADVFRTFLESLNTKRGPSKFLKAWLYKVAHNLMIDELRRNKHRNHDLLDEDQRDNNPFVSEQAERSIENKLLRRAMLQLTDKQQSVLYLKYLQGLSSEEIAYTLNMSIGTVKALQHRGLQSLNHYLSQSDQFSEKDI